MTENSSTELELLSSEKRADSEPVLTDFDRERIEAAGEIIAKKIASDYPTTLPDGILLPDTSGRPLAYLLNPILTQISKERDVAKPKIFFVSIPEDARSPMTKLNRKIEEAERIQIAHELERMKTQKRKAIALRGTLRERAAEINHSFEDPSDLKLVIVDDYALEGDTISVIREIFEQSIPAYSLLASSQAKDLKDFQYGILERNRQSVSDRIEGTDYRIQNKNSHGSSIGVLKSQYGKYANASSLRDVQQMRTIRAEMNTIGERIASKLKADTS